VLEISIGFYRMLKIGSEIDLCLLPYDRAYNEKA
jgi:hypothetical protein